MSDVTRMLSQIDAGEPAAAERLLPLVYDELRKLAAAKLSYEKPGQTLQATALVHEAYLRLKGRHAVASHVPGDTEAVSGDDKSAIDYQLLVNGAWKSRAHFFGAAAEAMRRILVENARRKASQKHGGQLERIELDAIELKGTERPTDDILAINEALSRLEVEDPQAAEIVKLRFFAGLSLTEAASAVGVSRTTAYEQWTYAKAWLRSAIDGTQIP